MSGVLHKYLEHCKKEAVGKDKADRRVQPPGKLLEVLCYLYQPKRVLTPSKPDESSGPPIASRASRRQKHQPSAFSPRLPPLATPIQEEINRYNRELIGIYSNYIWSACALTIRKGRL